MHYDLIDLAELDLSYILLIVAELLNSPKQLQFSVYFEFVFIFVAIFEHLYDFVVVEGRIVLLSLVESGGTRRVDVQPSVKSKQNVHSLRVGSEVLGALLWTSLETT